MSTQQSFIRRCAVTAALVAGLGGTTLSIAAPAIVAGSTATAGQPSYSPPVREDGNHVIGGPVPAAPLNAIGG